MIYHIKNVLNDDDFLKLSDFVMGPNMPWGFYPITSYKERPSRLEEDNIYQFVHPIFTIYGPSNTTWSEDFLHTTRKIIEKSIKHQYKIQRVKFNCLPRQIYNQEDLAFTVHKDGPENHTSLIFYCNDSDGETVIYEKNKEHRYLPEKNSCLVFPSSAFHRATPPNKSQRRVVLNIVIENK